MASSCSPQVRPPVHARLQPPSGHPHIPAASKSAMKTFRVLDPNALLRMQKGVRQAALRHSPNPSGAGCERVCNPLVNHD